MGKTWIQFGKRIRKWLKKVPALTMADVDQKNICYLSRFNLLFGSMGKLPNLQFPDGFSSWSLSVCNEKQSVLCSIYKVCITYLTNPSL
jgi:hypothetical protein